MVAGVEWEGDDKDDETKEDEKEEEASGVEVVKVRVVELKQIQVNELYCFALIFFLNGHNIYIYIYFKAFKELRNYFWLDIRFW